MGDVLGMHSHAFKQTWRYIIVLLIKPGPTSMGHWRTATAGRAGIVEESGLLQNSKERQRFWQELERIGQKSGIGSGTAVGRFYDTMGRPGAQAFASYANGVIGGIERVDRVRQALDQSGPMAKRQVMQQLSGIGLSTVWDILLSACKDIALYYGGAVVTGAVVGGAVGMFAFGVGAAPGVVVGAAAGSQVGTWVLTLLGLKELAEGLGTMFPAALKHYERGFREAWGEVSEERRDVWNMTATSSNVATGAFHMAQGHVLMVTAILTALVAYLSRGQARNALLLRDIRGERLGQKFADWVTENKERLLAHPQLQNRPSNSTAMAMGDASLPDGCATSSMENRGRISAGGASSPGRALQFEEFVAPSTGKSIQAAVNGHTFIHKSSVRFAP